MSSTLAERAAAIGQKLRQNAQQARDQRDSTPSTPAVEPTLAPTPEPLRSAWWSVHHWGGWPAQSVFTDPAATYAEMRALYPQAAGIIAADGA